MLNPCKHGKADDWTYACIKICFELYTFWISFT